MTLQKKYYCQLYDYSVIFRDYNPSTSDEKVPKDTDVTKHFPIALPRLAQNASSNPHYSDGLANVLT